MDRRAETFIIIIIGPKMIFWPNFSQIGGDVFFFKKWPFVHTHFLPFLTIFDIFWPAFGSWNIKCTKTDHLGAKGSKYFEKIGLVALIEIWFPQTPQNTPLAKKDP